MAVKWLLAAALLFTNVLAAWRGDARKSPVVNRTNLAPLNIFIIPHTHDDLGWTSTPDQYYVNQVQFILDSVMLALADNPARKFTYVEVGFFSRWWNQQDDAKKAQVQTLVNNGQLKFNLGGWNMNDEACTHYDREINQMTEGNQFLLKNLGPKAAPTTGWHIDPFGHSSATASLWADVGFNAFGLNRIDYRLKDQFKQNKQLEFVWRGSTSLGTQTQIWAHVMDSHYGSPGSITFDEEEGGKVINPDANLPTYGVDVDETAQDFINDCNNRATWYKHNNLLIPFGNDFTHKNAQRSLKELDILINYINNHSSFNAKVQYAHFDDYVAAVNALNLTWDIYTEDFFPYASGGNSYWTGYYTSHNQLKGFARSQTNLLRTTEIINVFKNQAVLSEDESLSSSLEFADTQSNIAYLRQAISSVQHHDGVSGTEKTFVVNDYSLQIQHGSDYVLTSLITLTGQLLTNGVAPSLTNNSVAATQAISSSKIVAVVLHNSLAWARQEFVSIPVNRTDLRVVDGTGATVPSQIDATASYQETIPAPYLLYFLVNIPALGFNTYYIQQSTFDGETPMGESVLAGSISNDFYTVAFDDTGRLSSITNKVSGKSSNLKQDLFQYKSADSSQGQASGAYVFRPATANVIGVGSNNGGVTKSVTATFPASFSQNPIIIVGPEGLGYNDTFVISVRTLSTTQVSVNAYRMDMDGWGQNVIANYLAFTPGSQPRTGWSGFQSGTVSIGTSTACKTVTVNFSPAFSSAPQLLATPMIGGEYDDALLATTIGISGSSATVNICRSNGVGWGVSATLLWTAFSNPTLDSSSHAGNAKVGSSNGQKLIVLTVPLTLAANSILLATARSSGESFAYTIQATSSSGVTVVVRKIDNTAWTDTTVSLDYLVFPRGDYNTFVVPQTQIIATKVVTGPYVQTVQQSWKAGYAQTIRLFKDGSNSAKNQALNYIDVTNDLKNTDKGWEVVNWWQTDINSGGNFVSDDNALERRQRKYDPSKTEPYAGNFYPAVQSSSINGQSSGQDIALTLVSDRTHGVTSTASGNLQVMLQRRCLNDDGYGVNEVLDETVAIAPHFRVTLDNLQNSATLRHTHQLLENYPPFPLYGSSSSASTWSGQYTTQWTPLVAALPANIHLLSFELRNPNPSLEAVNKLPKAKLFRTKSSLVPPTEAAPQSDRYVLLRLQQLYEANESTTYSVPVNVNLNQIFTPSLFNVTSAQETTLTATFDKASYKKLVWNVNSLNEQSTPVKSVKVDDDHLLLDTIVTLNPREIKTFRLNSSPL